MLGMWQPKSPTPAAILEQEPQLTKVSGMAGVLPIPARPIRAPSSLEAETQLSPLEQRVPSLLLLTGPLSPPPPC